MAAKYAAKCLLLALMLGGITVVEAANTPPTIGTIPDQTVFEDHPTDAYLLAVNDAETPVLSLQLSGASSNPGVVPPENIFFGVANGLWYLTVTPAFGVASGNSTITVTVSDGTTNASTSFLFTVNPPPPGATRFVNNSPISIPDGNAAPYPSQMTVSGKAGLITNMNLTLSKFSHGRVQDVNMLLVAPTGKGVVIFSHISGGNRSASNVTVYMTDTSLYPLPQDFALWSEPLTPTAYTPPSSFPGSAPAGPYAPVAFSSFNGLNPNGTWSLYVYDDTGGATGAITGGWSMTIFTDGSTGPQITPIANQFIAENSNTGPIPFTLSDPDTPLNSLILSTNSSNTTLVPLSNIVLGGSGASRTLTVTPAAGQTGTSTITVGVSDGTNNASASFVLTVSAPATQVRVETAANGSGTVAPARNINPGGSITVYAIARDAGGIFVTNVPASSWSLLNLSGGVVSGDLVAAADMKSATFTGHSAGSATIHVASAGLTSTDSGVLTVLSSAAPVITPIPDKTTLVGRSAGPFPITITDADTPAGNLILSGTSSDQTLVPNTNIFIYNSGAQSLTVTPAPGQTGTATITLTASDGVNITGNSFLLTVNPSGPGQMIFDNASVLTIPNTGPVSPYPSTINVSGMAGNITNLTLTLKDLTTPAPHDLEMLLVAPTGQKVVVFSRVGGGTASHLTVTLDDAAAYPLPPSPYAILTGTYQPTDLGHVDPFPSPAPAGPYATALSAFKGVSPDGDWNLYVIDDIGGNGAGTVAGGWSLAIATDNPITSPLTIGAIPNQTITMDTGTGPIPFTLSDPGTDLNTLMLSTNSSNTALVPLSNIVLGGSGANRTVTVTPAAGQTGTSTITVAVSDGTNNASTTFLLTVSAPPTQVRVETAANGSGTVVPTRNINLGSSVTVYAIARDAAGNFVTNVPADSWSLLNVSGGVASGDLVAAADMKSATFTGHSAGSATIHVASAGLTSTDSGTLTVLSSAPPVITPIPDKTTLVGRSAGPFPITITDADTPAGSLVLSGTSSDQTLVPNTNIFIYNSGAQSLTVTPAPGRTGTATITLTANDGVNITSNSFLLTVNPSGPGLMIFDNASLLTLPDTGSVTPYPSTINVSGMGGGITNLTLTLKDLTTPAPHDLEMLLVGPTGQKVVFFSRVGGGTASHISVTLDDTAFYELPPSPYQILTGTYKPKDFGNVDPFPSPAPAGPYGTTLSAFNGLSPNGAWNLYVIDDVAGNGAGTLAGGWSLAIATDTSDTPPTISSISTQTLTVNSASAAIPFTVNDAETPATNLTLAASSSNPTLAPTNRVVFGGSDTNRTLTITPVSNQLGTATITIIVSDGVLTASNSFLLTVNPLQMTVTIDNATRIYGTTNPTFTGTLTGLQAGDNITATFTTTAVTNTRVGTYAIVPLFSDPGSKLGNYQVTTNGGTLTITKASLIVTATGTNKVYNGTTAAGVTLSDNRLAGDSLTASYTNASFADKNVGTGKPVSVSGITISGTSATNYTCNTTASTTANITPRALVVSAAGVSRAYNGTTAATVVLSDNRVAGDSLAVTYASASFPDKNAALGKAVSVSGIAVSGTDSTNYTFNATAATTADITPAGLMIVGAAAQDKPYDGTTTATPDISSAGLVGVVSGDAVTLNSAGSVGTFDTKSVGTGKTVRITGLALSGADATNYTLTQMIAPGLVAAYAFSEGVGTTVADASGNGNIGTLANVTWTNVGRFGTALVFNGTSAKATINDSVLLHLTTGMTLEAWVNPSTVSSAWRDVIYKGNDNYYLEATSASAGNGRPATGGTFTGGSGPLYATAALTTNSWTHLAATYDGATLRLYVNGVQVASRAQTGNIATSTNYLQIAGDTFNQQFFQGAIDEVRVYNVARTAAQIQADMSTPIFPYSALTTTANITEAPLGVAGISADDKVYDGTTTATLHTNGASLVGVITGDSLTLNVAGATGAFTDANVGNNKTVNVSGLTLSGADVPNYRLNQPSTTANITPAATTNLVSSSANPSAPGTPVTFTATLVAAGVNPAVGTVQFLTNGVAVGNPLLLSNGVAAINMAFAATGTNTVIATYAGDGNFLGSTNSLVQIVIAQGSVTLGIKANGDQTVTVTFSGTPGSNYVVQVTSDLSSPTAWSNVATNTAGGDGRWTFTDSATRPHYYYRSATAP